VKTTVLVGVTGFPRGDDSEEVILKSESEWGEASTGLVSPWKRFLSIVVAAGPNTIVMQDPVAIERRGKLNPYAIPASLLLGVRPCPSGPVGTGAFGDDEDDDGRVALDARIIRARRRRLWNRPYWSHVVMPVPPHSTNWPFQSSYTALSPQFALKYRVAVVARVRVELELASHLRVVVAPDDRA
jgi:hypothetical protein